MKQKATFERVRESYPDAKARSDRINSPYSYYVLGGLSIRLAPFFINLGFSPNAVTGLSLVVLIIALWCFAQAPQGNHFFLLGAIFLNGVLVLDNVDGHVARFQRETSKAGELADSCVTWLYHSLLPVCVGFGLYRTVPERWLVAWGVDIPQWVWPLAGLVRAYCCLFYTVVGYKARGLLEGRRYDERVKTARLTAIRALVEIEAMMLVIASLLGLVSLIHIGYVTLHVVIFFLVIIRNFVDLRTSDVAGK